MVRLMEALRTIGYYPQVVGGDLAFTAKIGASIHEGAVENIAAEERHKSGSLALALAAAAALQIEVPDPSNT
jgi:hypothetical protein